MFKLHQFKVLICIASSSTCQSDMYIMTESVPLVKVCIACGVCTNYREIMTTSSLRGTSEQDGEYEMKSSRFSMKSSNIVRNSVFMLVLIQH